jgi:hypothetical protein
MYVQAGATTLLLVLLVGCSAPLGSSGPTEATGAEVTVAQGESDTVTITASWVSRLQIAAPSTNAIDLLGFNEATIEPTPDIVLESLPPIWEWDSPAQELSVTLPVVVPDEFDPGTYRFTVRATGSSTDQTAEAQLVVQVTESDTTG